MKKIFNFKKFTEGNLTFYSFSLFGWKIEVNILS